MFTKYWVPGAVKTRLGRTIGPESAANLYREFVGHLAIELADSADQRLFVVSPDEDVKRSFFQQSTHWQSIGQGSGDLGQRLKRFFQSATPDDQLIVIGGDCPTISSNLIAKAFSCLERVPVVLGPSTDGGYYLLGIRGPWTDSLSCLFEDIDWGTPQVLQQTIDKLEHIGIDRELLETDRDIDDLEDLQELNLRIAKYPELAAVVHHALEIAKDSSH